MGCNLNCLRWTPENRPNSATSDVSGSDEPQSTKQAYGEISIRRKVKIDALRSQTFQTFNNLETRRVGENSVYLELVPLYSFSSVVSGLLRRRPVQDDTLRFHVFATCRTNPVPRPSDSKIRESSFVNTSILLLCVPQSCFRETWILFIFAPFPNRRQSTVHLVLSCYFWSVNVRVLQTYRVTVNYLLFFRGLWDRLSVLRILSRSSLFSAASFQSRSP